MIKAICIEKPHRAIALTDGWLCIKYLEGGEESLTTFADISKGDVITYGRSHPYNPQAEREKVLDDVCCKIRKYCQNRIWLGAERLITHIRQEGKQEEK